MNVRSITAAGALLAVIHVPIAAKAPGRALPLRNGRPIVATVDKAAISLDELVFQLERAADRARLLRGRATSEELAVLDRLINVKVIMREAETMGLAELPEIRKQVEVQSREILREVLLERVTRNVKPDPAAVEKQFRDLVREWKTTSLVFRDEAAAQRARKEIGAGAAFSDVAARAAAAKTAKPERDDSFHPKKDYLPQIAEVLARLRAGEVSPVVRLQAGFVLVKVLEVRYPENREARAEARKVIVTRQQQRLLDAREQAARRNYVVVNKARLKGLDYEAAQPTMDALLNDRRAIAQIKGAPPLTVADLSDYLRMQFFHGTDQAKQRKEMNSKKQVAFEAMLSRRLLNSEAVRLGIDKTNAYRDRVNGYRESLIFDTFVKKVIVPANKMREEDVKGYYSGHVKEYSYPEMLKVRSLAFGQRSGAESAMKKLRDGTDYGWLAANAEGQVARDAPGLLTFDGRPVTTASMPDGMRKAVAGTKAGDLRLYASPEGHFYVLSVQQVIAANPKPYDEVRDEIAAKLFSDRLTKSAEEYAARLRKHSDIRTYLVKVQ